MDGFLLTYDGFEPGSEGLREALTSTGNGYLCTRGAAEWEEADGVHYPGTYVHGGYNRETTILSSVPVRSRRNVHLARRCGRVGLGTPSARAALRAMPARRKRW